MTKQKPPVGLSDFRKLISGNYYYVDKSAFIREIIDASAEVILLPRPRRFGKTLNMDMLKVFFEAGGDDAGKFFKGLSIEKEDCFAAHRGRYPVISITLKDLKHIDWNACFQGLKAVIYETYASHRYLLDGDALYPDEKNRFEAMLNGAADVTDCEGALKFLSKLLCRRHDAPVVILIDEYDTPLHAGYANGYYDKMIGFMRNFLSGGLKDNPHLFKGVLTGILRVARESIFSGLNNLGVYTILDKQFSESFGFTEADVLRALSDFGMSDDYGRASSWYNGYVFGEAVIYNPWSVINFIDAGGLEKPYWLNTGDTSVLDRLATRGGREIREEIGRLIEGKAIAQPVYETIVMRDLDLRDDLLWSFLLFSGYLKPSGPPVRRNIYPLTIPNREVRLAYEEMVIRWFSEKIETSCLTDMLQSLETGEMALFERLLRKIVTQVMSYHDFSGAPEKVYHALTLGILVWLSGKYDIRSNRESGYGRYDVMLKPKDVSKPGVVIEFKLVDGAADDAHEAVLEDALKQIRKRGYAAELSAAGVENIIEMAVAFRGKELWVRRRKILKSPVVKNA